MEARKQKLSRQLAKLNSEILRSDPRLDGSAANTKKRRISDFTVIMSYDNGTPRGGGRRAVSGMARLAEEVEVPASSRSDTVVGVFIDCREGELTGYRISRVTGR
jgi:hypothetical protein